MPPLILLAVIPSARSLWSTLNSGRRRALFDSVETEQRGNALFEKAWRLREGLDRNEKRPSQLDAEDLHHVRLIQSERPRA